MPDFESLLLLVAGKEVEGVSLSEFLCTDGIVSTSAIPPGRGCSFRGALVAERDFAKKESSALLEVEEVEDIWSIFSSVFLLIDDVVGSELPSPIVVFGIDLVSTQPLPLPREKYFEMSGFLGFEEKVEEDAADDVDGKELTLLFESAENVASSDDSILSLLLLCC